MMMTIHPTKSLRPQAVLQRLVWRRGYAATWKTVDIFPTRDAALAALRELPSHLMVRVLLGVPEAIFLGALTRDTI